MRQMRWIGIFSLFLAACTKTTDWQAETRQILAKQILEDAAWALEQQPTTITAYPCPRSEGGIHDFYSEGDYWWPDPEDPEGPYIRRDGASNPNNFVAHREAMIRFSRIVGALASAYLLTGETRYVDHAVLHLQAWFADSETRMNPRLDYAQAIRGITPGRGIGIIDTIHLMEVAQAILRMRDAMDPEMTRVFTEWFRAYVSWLTTSSNGIEEMNTKNNHATCWVMQTAVFARLTGDEPTLELCRKRYEEYLLPGQMAADGSFPLELERTKPYGYSLFNLDAMALTCTVLSTPDNDLWRYHTPDGRNLRRAVDFMTPYIRDKTSWPYPHDVMYWEAWPIAHPALLFAAIAYDDETCFRLWARLPHRIAAGEVERNVPVRNPLIWME